MFLDDHHDKSSNQMWPFKINIVLLYTIIYLFIIIIKDGGSDS